MNMMDDESRIRESLIRFHARMQNENNEDRERDHT